MARGLVLLGLLVICCVWFRFGWFVCLALVVAVVCGLHWLWFYRCVLFGCFI